MRITEAIDKMQAQKTRKNPRVGITKGKGLFVLCEFLGNFETWNVTKEKFETNDKGKVIYTKLDMLDLTRDDWEVVNY